MNRRNPFFLEWLNVSCNVVFISAIYTSELTAHRWDIILRVFFQTDTAQVARRWTFMIRVSHCTGAFNGDTVP